MPSLGIYARGMEISIYTQNPYLNIYNNFIYCHQKLATIQISFSWEKVKKRPLCTKKKEKLQQFEELDKQEQTKHKDSKRTPNLVAQLNNPM